MTTHRRTVAARNLGFLAIALVVLGLPSLAGAQARYPDSSRAGRWEFLVSPLWQNSQTTEFEGDSKMETEGEFGFSLGAGYNVNERLNLNFQVQWSDVDYDAHVAGDTPGSYVDISGAYYQWSTFFGADFNILTSPLTPYVSGAIGYSWFDTNVPNGLPVTGCWWDPWYGYICSTYYPTKTVDSFSYKGGLGLRFDINPRFFMKAGYEIQWHDLQKSNGAADFGAWRIDLGFMNF